jgi:hypothetical protein
MVASEISQNMMTLIAEGAGEEDENADLILRQHAVELYTRLLDKPYAQAYGEKINIQSVMKVDADMFLEQRRIYE